MLNENPNPDAPQDDPAPGEPVKDESPAAPVEDSPTTPTYDGVPEDKKAEPKNAETTHQASPEDVESQQ